jgi:acetolactate synthase-1/2/3 large subunit
MKGAQIFVESLIKENVDTVFYYTGGSVVEIFDELYKHRKEIMYIQPRHEQAGVHMADGYARATGDLAVMVVTSGPGATNTVSAIATAYMDSIPMLVVTGQVPTSKIGTDAFQEADIVGLTLPITKANFLVKDVDELAMTLKNAFHIARTGRPGPVLVDIPVNVQKENTQYHYPKHPDLRAYKIQEKGHSRQIKAALKLIDKSKKPVVIIGGGVNLADAMALANQFIDKFNIPAVSTLMGRGINPQREDLCFNFLGIHGALYANYAVQNADLLIALGVRFSDRIMGDAQTFAPHAKKIHVDIDPAEIGKNISVDVPIVGDIRSVLKDFVRAEITNDHAEWIEELNDYKVKHPLTYDNTGELKPQYIIQLANKYFPDDTIVVTDVGQHQMWVAQYYQFKHPRTLITSGGLGTMGFGLPAAIGAKIGKRDKEVLMVAGDGGFQMNIQELATVKRYGLNIKMIVMDNFSLGMVRQWQELLYGKRYLGTPLDCNPDFAKIAEAYRIKSRTLKQKGEAKEAIKELAKSGKSMLIHALIDKNENVLPWVPSGRSLDDVVTKI